MKLLKHIAAGVLEVAYEEAGTADGIPVVLLHGFPYDVRAFDEVTPLLVARGCRVIAPYLRGYGPTRFLSAGTPRSGQQAVLGHDLVALMDALAIPSAVLGGYDWGGRAACVVTALWPERVRGLVSCGGYNIQDIAGSAKPQPPESEYRHWYQYYFHGERGRAGLAQNRRELCRLLWRLWSPNWRFDDATYERTAVSFDNPDFVDVVIHSYRHRYGLAPGDPSVEATEQRLAARPPITVPTVVLHGSDNGVTPARNSEGHPSMFTGPYERHVIPGGGHNVPQEAPREFASAILSLIDPSVARRRANGYDRPNRQLQHRRQAMAETPTFGRYAEIPYDQMTPEQQEGYRSLIETRGRLPGPNKIYVHNPKLAKVMGPLGAHFRTGYSLSEREREIAVCIINSKWHSAYPTNAHERAGKAAGLANDKVEAILSGLPASFSDKREQVVYEMATCLANSRWVAKGLYDRAVEALGHVGITDVITLMGFYTSVSMTLAFYDVPAGATGMER